MALNMFVAMGRLARDPEDKSNGNKAIARFTLAVDRWKKNDPADFFDCTAFGSTAEAVLGKKQNCLDIPVRRSRHSGTVSTVSPEQRTAKFTVNNASLLA